MTRSRFARAGGRLALLAVVLLLLLGLLNPNKRLKPRRSTLTSDDLAEPTAKVRFDAHDVQQQWVPPGCFRRGANPRDDRAANGSETPQHDVCITRGFWIDAFEVSNASYMEFIETGGYTTREYWSNEAWEWKGSLGSQEVPPAFNDANQPRVWVSWYEAEAYAKWRGGRLPTEAEWEYAARGPENRIWPWGDEWDPERANTLEREARATVSVNSLPDGRSWVGAWNMAGNAWEWTHDWYDARLYRAAIRMDPAGPQAGTERVMRGGSWAGPAASARTSQRSRDLPSHRSISLGFRLVTDS